MKKLRSIVSGALVVVTVFSLWVLSGCSSSSNPPPAPTQNLLQLMSSASFKQSATVTADKALDSLVKYINIYPDLVTLLTGTTPYTVFAPSNTAFISLLATPGFPSNIKLINPAIIEGVLKYHIIAGAQLQSALTPAASFPTLYTDLATATVQNIVINSDGTLKTGSTNQSIAIVVANQKATNGVFHVTGSVLIPPSVGSTLTPILGTLAGTVMLGASFSDLATIIMAADATFTQDPSTGKFKISTWLAMPISASGAITANLQGITFFAPPNQVFAAAAAAQSVSESAFVSALAANPTTARALLLNHLVVSAKYTTAGGSGSTQFANAQTITPASGASMNITVSVGSPSVSTGPYGITLVNTTPSGAYIAQELLTPSNGSLEVIAGILK
ncbi:MAG: fasciclin domain-containing protein [Bacteroidetes bacterium]|nr:fasciclin domain-containing protein [Bacteroidota bacterium]